MSKHILCSILVLLIILPHPVSAKPDTEDAEIDMIMHQVDKEQQLRDAVMETVMEKVWTGMIRGGFLSGDRLITPYTDIFVPLWQDDQSLVFFNLKVAITSQTNEENIGLGYRKMIWDDEMILGANIFYDTKLTRRTNRFHQLGFGLEALSHWVDSRANFYFPLTDPKRVPSLSRFSFSQTGLIEAAGFEEALRGFDFEVGLLIPKLSDYFETRVFGGAFFYESRKAEGVIGGRLRVETYLNDYVTLEFSIDWPTEHEPRIFWGGYVTLPFELGKNFKQMNPLTNYKKLFTLGKGVRPLRERMTDRVTRDIDVQTDAGASTTREQIEEVIFVDNSNDGDPQEDGSRSHPHNTLAEAFTNPRYGAGKTIRVEEGDGTIAGYTGNYTLADNVKLWGSGSNVGYPGTPTTSGNPLIDGGGAGDTITLASNNTVMGTTIQNAGQYGITGTNPGTVVIKNNLVTANTGDQIHFDTTGNSTNHISIINNTITNGGDDGIDLKSNDNTIDTLIVKGNIIRDHVDLGIIPDVNDALDSSTQIVIISNNTLTNDRILSQLKGTANQVSKIINNTVTDAGITVGSFDSAVATTTISNNTITNPVFDGIWVGTFGAGGTPTVNGTVSNNLVDGNALLANIDVSGIQAGSNINITIKNNTVRNNASVSGGIGLATLGTINASVFNNISTNNAKGIVVGSAGLDGTYNVDLGGGSLGSRGRNSVFNNTVDFSNEIPTATTIKAENNWWGTANPVGGQFNGLVDYTPNLTFDPN